MDGFALRNRGQITHYLQICPRYHPLVAKMSGGPPISCKNARDFRIPKVKSAKSGVCQPFRPGRASLAGDFSWQVRQIRGLPTIFWLAFAWGGQIMVGKSSKVALCQLFSGQPRAGIAKKELANPPNQHFANYFSAHICLGRPNNGWQIV